MFIDAVYYTLKGSTVKRPCILPYIGGAMWAKLRSFFDRYPAQEKVAQLMVLHGFRVHDNRIYAAAVELSDTAMARAAAGARRVAIPPPPPVPDRLVDDRGDVRARPEDVHDVEAARNRREVRVRLPAQDLRGRRVHGNHLVPTLEQVLRHRLGVLEIGRA